MSRSSSRSWNRSSSRRPWLLRHRTSLLDTMAERQLRGATKTGRRGVTSALIGLLALPMNLLTVAFLAVGVFWLVTGPTGLRVLGVCALLAFVVTAPRPDRRELHGLDRDAAPTLFALLDQIATQTGAPVPARVLMDTRFNCAVTQVRRHPVLVVGAPLWSALDGPARVAVLGHELGHLAHRDLLAAQWPGWARQSAQHWYDVGRTGASLNRRTALASRGHANLGAVPTAVLLGGFRAVAAGYLWSLDVVNAADSRRREYLADRAAVRAGGSAGALALFDTLLAADTVSAAMTRAALDPRRPDLWAAVATAGALSTPGSRGRRRAAVRGEENRVDSSHPRTELRIRLVEQQAQVDAGVALSRSEWARVDRELAATLTALADRARDDVRYGRR